MTDYRACFDAVISFSNGGDLTVHGFRIDVPGPDADEAEIAALFVASLGLLMTDRAELSNVEIVAEPHKGTRAGPSDAAAGDGVATGQFVELSHVIRAGMITYPGLPGPQINPYLTREASRERYAPGTEFAIDQLTLVGNTGTYLDAPYHRFAEGADLSSIALARTVDVPAVLARVTGASQRRIGVGALAALDVRGKAVLLHTGDDARFGTPAYANEAHFLTRSGAAWLAGHRAALVGIDAINIDDTDDGERPAHTTAAQGRRSDRRAPDGSRPATPDRRTVHRGAIANRGIRRDSRTCIRANTGMIFPPPRGARRNASP